MGAPPAARRLNGGTEGVVGLRGRAASPTDSKDFLNFLTA